MDLSSKWPGDLVSCLGANPETGTVLITNKWDQASPHANKRIVQVAQEIIENNVFVAWLWNDHTLLFANPWLPKLVSLTQKRCVAIGNNPEMGHFAKSPATS